MDCPALSVVARDEQIRLQVIVSVTVDGDVSRAGVEVRGVDARDPVDVIRGQPWHVLSDLGERRARSLLTCTFPSSVPAQTTPGNTGDSETETIVL